MSYAIKSGTIEAVWIDTKPTPAGCVRFDGAIVVDAGGQTLMVWDAGLGNIRPMTQAEIDALPAQQQAARDATEPDLATLRDQVTQAIADINAYLVNADTATNAQVRAEVKAIDVRQRAMIKALGRLVRLALT
jgi:hypothetical protein